MATAATRKPCAPSRHRRRKARQAQRQTTMGKAKRDRVLPENEAKAVAKNLQGFAAEAEPGRPDDPRQEGGHGAGGPRVLEEAHRQGRQEVRDVGGGQCREQPRPRRQRPRGQRGLRRQEPGDHALPRPRPRPHEPDREAVRAAHRRGAGARGRAQPRRPSNGSQGQSGQACASASTARGTAAGSPAAASTASCCTRTCTSATTSSSSGARPASPRW